MGFVQNIRQGKLYRGGVVEEEVLEEPRWVGGVGNGAILDGEDGGIWGRKEDFGDDLEDGGDDVESGFSQSFGGVE